jgi:putative hemolysin
MEPSLDSAPPRSRPSRSAFFLLALLFASSPVFAAPATEAASHEGDLTGIGWKLAIVLALVLLNGFFVASEFSLVAVRRTRIDQLAAEGSRGAKAVQKAVKHLDRYIAATQVGVTVASLILGSVGETTLEPLMGALFAWMPEKFFFITRIGVATVLAYLLMTALHVILGELVPKSITLNKSEAVAMVCVRPMSLFVKLTTPLVWALTGIARGILRLLGIKKMGEHENVHSPEELDILVSQSHQGGELNDTEAEILHRVVRFSDLTLREVMVPRVEMQALPVEMPRLALRAWIHSKPHSRVPVYIGSVDDVIGVVHLKDMAPFITKMGEGDDDSLVSLMPLVRDPLRLPETSTVDKLLVEFKKSRQQMAIVIDEFSGTAGLITLGDLLDQVFGDMADEFDTPEEIIAQADDGRVYLAGRTLIDEINQKFDTGFRQDEADTVAGLVLTELGRPAKVGDEVELNGAKIRVEAVERIRITRVSLLLHQSEDAAREAALETA